MANTSCIDTDLSNCARFSLTVQAVDANGDDITTSGEAGDVRLFIFDYNLYFIDEVDVASERIVNGEALRFNYPGFSNTLWVVAWGNVKGNQTVLPTNFNRSTHIASALMQLKRDAEGYAVQPDDLFYGISEVCGQCSDNTVVIGRKTALMSIIARGVPDSQLQDYSFVARGAKEDAFDFLANLTGTPIDYREVGAFVPASKSGTISTIKPFRVYPLSVGNRLTIEVYNGQTLIASANKDDQGRAIVPMPGQTINILLNFSGQAGPLEVKVEITDWEKLFNWFEY